MAKHSEDPSDAPATPRKIALDKRVVVAHRRTEPRHPVLRGLAVAVVAVLLISGGYVAYNYHVFTSGVTHVDAIPQVAVGNAVAPPDIDGVAQNILLVGDDHRPDGATDEDLAKLGTESDGGATNTDTMMLVHLPADGSSATLISFPRDSYVTIPGYGRNKLNAAFSLGSQDGGGPSGGAQLLITTIQNLTGLTIDHYVRVSMLGFYNVVDALGPVEVCLNNAVNDPYSTLNLPAGVSTLNAQQALSFVRQRRGLENGDLDRQVRQQYFLTVEARKILSAGTLLNPVKLRNVLTAVSSAMETDPDLDFILLAAQMRNLSADRIVTATIPNFGGVSITVGGRPLSIVDVDVDAMPGFIDALVNGPSAYDAAIAAPVDSVTVTVVDARAIEGIAAETTAALAGFGFLTTTPTSAAAIATTTIQYPAGMEAAAKTLSTYFPGAAVAETEAATGVSVLLGTDGLILTDPAVAAPITPATPAPEETPVGTTFAAGSCIN